MTISNLFSKRTIIKCSRNKVVTNREALHISLFYSPICDYPQRTSFVWWQQTMVWWEQTMVWRQQTIVWRQQTIVWRQQTTRTRRGACANASSSIKAEEEARKNNSAANTGLTLAATIKRHKRADRKNGRARL